jgi:hypothetical protein
MRSLLVAAAIGAAPIVAAAAGALAPSTIAGSPSTYNGKTVTVTGKVEQFSRSSTPMGQVAGFQLCDTKCIVVIDKTNQSRTDGASATVTGTFQTTFKGPRRTFTNAVVISH